MALETSVAAHMSTQYGAMVAYMKDPFFEFPNALTSTCRLLWTLPLTAPWHEFRLWYHDFIVTGDLGVDGEQFQILAAWTVVIKELLMRDGLELKGISNEFLLCIFPALDMHPLIIPPSPLLTQGPPPLQSLTQQPLASSPKADSGDGAHSSEGLGASGEVHVVVDVPSSP